MTKSELAKLLEEFGEIFPRLNQSETALKFWFNAVGEFRADVVRSAFTKHMNGSANTPSIADIRGLCNGIVGRQSSALERSRWTRPYKRIEFCMDMLGPGFVSDELRLVLGGDDAKTALALVGRKDWIPAYKTKLQEMTDYACQLWLQGQRPEFQFTGTDDQTPWVHADIPVFDDERMIFVREHHV